jgi:hypothetical protein
MITIRDDQLTLTIANEQGFVDWYVNKFMPKFMPVICQEISETTRKARVRKGRALAIAYGFLDPKSQAHFVTFLWEMGPKFYTFSGYKEIIENTKQSMPNRIERLYDEITEAEEEKAIKGFNEKDWED